MQVWPRDFLPPLCDTRPTGHTRFSIDSGAVYERPRTFLKSNGLMRKKIPSPIEFQCSNCGARYEVVRLKALPEPTTGPETTCLSCGAPLHSRETDKRLKVRSKWPIGALNFPLAQFVDSPH